VGVVPDGGEKFAALARALDKAAETGLLKELLAGVTDPLRAMIPTFKAAQREVMPKRGGMADYAAATTKLSVRRRNTGRYPGVRLVASQKGRIRRQDQGVLRHPVHERAGTDRDTWSWVNQTIPAGWFTRTADEAAPRLRKSAAAAMDRVARRIDIDVTRSGGARR